MDFIFLFTLGLFLFCEFVFKDILVVSPIIFYIDFNYSENKIKSSLDHT